VKRYSAWSIPQPLRSALRRTRAVRNRVLSDVLMELPGLAAKTYPIAANETFYLTPGSSGSDGRTGDDTLPVPPLHLREGYGESTQHYLDIGRQHVAAMREILATADRPLEQAGRILDFGCSAGTMLRWLVDIASDRPVWGVDVNASHIDWCQDQLSPPFYFATTTSLPHLPFEDGYFDLVYSGSVFSHIADLADSWVLELRRILRVGGRAYITIHDKHSIDVILGDTPQPPIARVLSDFERHHDVDLRTSDFSVVAISRAPRTSIVFYDIDHVTRRWGRFLDVVSVTQEAYGYQTALLLEKRMD
jgi:SAM-dependent methyltransferase